MLKKLLAATLLAASAAPALSLTGTQVPEWAPKPISLCNFTENNQAFPRFIVVGGQGEDINTGRVIGGGINPYIGVGQCAKFMVLPDPPCLWRVTAYSAYQRPITWHVPFNVCGELKKITIKGNFKSGYTWIYE